MDANKRESGKRKILAFIRIHSWLTRPEFILNLRSFAKSADKWVPKEVLMMVIGVLIFSIVAPLASYGIAKAPLFDQGKLAASLVLVAWGSMLFGLVLSRLAQ
jgi:hypothetical protein